MPFFLDICVEYLHSDILQNEYKKGTLRNKRGYLNSVNSFIKNDLKPESVDHALLDDLYSFVRSKGNSMTNSARTVDFVKKAMVYAKKRKYIQVNETVDYYPKRDKVKPVINCNENELKSLFYAETQSNAERRVKDLYLAQCYTGMSWGDLRYYKIVDRNGEKWLFNKRNKTGTEYWLPLDKISTGLKFLELHDKYMGKLPHPRLAEYNSLIRKLAEKLGIHKHLTSHTARKTFATIMDMDGISHETIAYMMGITVQVLTKHYITRSIQRVEKEFKMRQAG